MRKRINRNIKDNIQKISNIDEDNKDDGDNKPMIQKARHDYEQALHILRHEGWVPTVRTCSSLEKRGLDVIWNDVNHFYVKQVSELKIKRQTQLIQWMDQLVKESLLRSFESSVGQKLLTEYKEKVKRGELTPYQSSQELISLYLKHS